ncbi:DNA mismatch repair protein [Tulasnella sp. 427]|nr:DNA mismatch repair protein [Tulasnella sp. 427]
MNHISRSGFEITIPEIADPSTSRSQPTTVPDSGQTKVAAVPKLLYSRLSKSAELSLVLKAFISLPDDRLADFELDDDASFSSSSADDNCDSAWLNALKLWPQEFINLVNSKACRGAIMFNDSLSQLQCETLIAQLAETVFPYQCAHGRPSVIPLAALSDAGPIGANSRKISWSKFGQEVRTRGSTVHGDAEFSGY